MGIEYKELPFCEREIMILLFNTKYDGIYGLHACCRMCISVQGACALRVAICRMALPCAPPCVTEETSQSKMCLSCWTS